MLNSVWFWLGLFVVYLALVITSDIEAYQKGKWKRLKYNLKSQYNGFSRVLDMILGLYLVVIGTIPIPSISDWVKNQIASVNEPYGRVVWACMPLAYLVILILFMLWFVVRGIIPAFKLSDEEKQWKKEDDSEFNNKIRQWLHLKSKAEIIGK